MSPPTRARLFFGITVLLAVVFVRLGIWQVSRLEARRAHNRAAEDAGQRPALALADPAAGAGLPEDSLAFRRAIVSGRYDHAADIILRGQTEGGVPGVRIVTPLRPLQGDTAILVQRGFVPSPDAATVDPASLREEGLRRVAGVLFLLADSGVKGEPRDIRGQLTWRRVELTAIRARLPYPVAGFLLLQTPDSALPALPRRDEPPALDDGPHLSYAIQWFAFAVTALVVGGIVGFPRNSGSAIAGTTTTRGHEDRAT